MGYLAVIAAAAAAFAFGALWYGLLSGPWKAASGVPLDADGDPVNARSPVPYAISFVAIIVVAGFLRHLLNEVGADSVAKAVQWGTGVGLFFIAPWIALGNAYTVRPARLTLIDGGYAVIGCGIMAAILVWLAPEVG